MHVFIFGIIFEKHLPFLPIFSGQEASETQLMTIAKDCCSAVATLQSVEIIHRDIAARNFLLTKFLQVKLSDFGMAKQTVGGSYYSQNETAIPVRYEINEGDSSLFSSILLLFMLFMFMFLFFFFFFFLILNLFEIVLYAKI
jgi:serine/threonine protein kinase